MSRPNFLVFMTDHQRGDMQPPYHQAITPNLERLYQNGVAFRQAYCPAPHCCPSRATFFSGLYPSEHGVWNNVNVANTLSRGLNDGVRLFSEDLRDAGYQMYFSGKWHVSAEEGPQERGFDLLYHPEQYHKYPRVPTAEDEAFYQHGNLDTEATGKTVPGQILRPGYPSYIQYGNNESPYHDREVVDAALDQLDKLDDHAPFFLYVGPLGPHDPYFVPQHCLDLYPPESIRLPESFHDSMEDKPRLYGRTRRQYAQLSEAEQRESIRHYLAFCTYEDELFGKLLDRLEERKLLDTTCVIYVSDHGDYVGAHGLWAKGLPCFDEAYHICSVVGYAGITRRGEVEDHLLSLADYAPTLLELAGISTNRRFSGRSLVPLLRGEAVAEWPEWRYTQTNGNEIYGIQRSVANNEWKYVFNSFDEDELYNLKHDPLQLHNLAGDPAYESVVHDLCRQMWRFALQHQDTIINPYIMTALAPVGPGEEIVSMSDGCRSGLTMVK